MTVVQVLAIGAAVCLFFRPARAYRLACELAERIAAGRRHRRAELEHEAELERLWGRE